MLIKPIVLLNCIAHEQNGAGLACIARTASRSWLSELDDNWPFERAHTAWLDKTGLDHKKGMRFGFLEANQAFV